MDFQTREEIQCFNGEDVVPLTVHAGEPVSGSPSTTHCAPDQMVPHTGKWHYGSCAKGINLIVVEEVIDPYGLNFKTPRLVIQDRTSPFGLDRVTEKDASVATAQIALRLVGRTHIQ